MNLTNTQLLVELDILQKQMTELKQKESLIKQMIEDFHFKTENFFYQESEDKQIIEPRLSVLIMKVIEELGPRVVQDRIDEFSND